MAPQPNRPIFFKDEICEIVLLIVIKESRFAAKCNTMANFVSQNGNSVINYQFFVKD